MLTFMCILKWPREEMVLQVYSIPYKSNNFSMSLTRFSPEKEDGFSDL